jgi:hypothetical protein
LSAVTSTFGKGRTCGRDAPQFSSRRRSGPMELVGNGADLEPQVLAGELGVGENGRALAGDKE